MTKPDSEPRGLLGRRTFLRGAGALSAGALGAGAFSPFASGRGFTSAWLPAIGRPRNVVLVQLAGGNDGLSTVVPHGDDELYKARRTTPAERSKLRKIDDFRSFHPALATFERAFKDGHMALIEGCGYPDPVRSHFKSFEIWHTGRSAGRASGDGWVGRLVAEAWGEAGVPDLAVHLGGAAPYSLHSVTHPPVALVSPTGYRWFGDEEVYAMGGEAICEHGPMEGDDGAPRDPKHEGRDRALAALRSTLDDANESSARIRKAAAAYSTPIEYPRHRLAAGLRDVAALIDGQVGTRVFSVSMGGFDTHTGQKQRHDRLMTELDESLGAFMKDLARTPAGEDTLVVVFSEFGRRVKENGSQGHDHGKAAPMFVFGPKVKGGLYGKHPSLTDLDDGDLKFTTDFRTVYAGLIERWFEQDAAAVLGKRYAPLEFV